MHGWLVKVVPVQRDEVARLLWSFGYFFCLLAAYYLIRPLREEMAVQYGADRMQYLFTGTFATMTVLIPVFGWLASHLPVHRLLPAIYLGFMVLLAGFWTVFASGVEHIRVAPFFFVFVSVFNLFVVSVFWSFMADIWRTESARRLFGFIAAGGSLGAVVGPLAATLLVTALGTDALLLASAAMLALALVCIAALLRLTGARGTLHGGRAADGDGGRDSLWIGVRRVATSPYLAGIALFVVCYTVLGVMLYYLQLDLVKRAVPDPVERTRLFAGIDMAINAITVVLQLAVTGRLLSRFGATAMLVALPVVSLAGFAVLGAWTVLPVLIAFGVLRRVGEFAISKPTRETLFTVVPRHDKYQAKNVIDTVIHRAGDAGSSWFVAALVGAGLGLSAIAWAGVPIAALWLVTGGLLGRKHEALRRAHGDVGAGPADGNPADGNPAGAAPRPAG